VEAQIRPGNKRMKKVPAESVGRKEEEGRKLRHFFLCDGKNLSPF
jgi:hypothetical protein